MTQQQQQQRYKVIEKIASGGMAEVFRAESAGLEGFKKTVAIKRVLPHLAEKKQFIGMFLDEARVSAHLNHSNCVQVFDIGVGDNTYFIVMEYVNGADLKAVIEHQKQSGQRVPVEEACLISVRLCEGLAYAHELTDSKGHSLNIVHRDMSPPNVLLTKSGEIKIVDFGLAKANSQLEQSEPGIIKGKFSYLSPEAAQGEEVDARTDVFAVGIILWELLAGRRLFLGDTDLETVRQVQNAVVPPLRQFNPAVGPELERVIAKALARDRRQRYQSAREFGQELNQVMFHFGRAVSSFDIARVVEPIWRARVTEKRKGPADRVTIIGSLIDEALFQFTSLKSEDSEQGSDSSNYGATPLNIGSFEDVQTWADDLSDLSQRPGTKPTSRQFEAGNLSALEDDSPFSSRPPRRASPAPGPNVPSTAPQPPAPVNPATINWSDYPTEPPTRRRGLLVIVILLILIAGGAAAAYFGGYIPQL